MNSSSSSMLRCGFAVHRRLRKRLCQELDEASSTGTTTPRHKRYLADDPCRSYSEFRSVDTHRLQRRIRSLAKRSRRHQDRTPIRRRLNCSRHLSKCLFPSSPALWYWSSDFTVTSVRHVFIRAKHWHSPTSCRDPSGLNRCFTMMSANSTFFVDDEIDWQFRQRIRSCCLCTPDRAYHSHDQFRMGGRKSVISDT